MQFFLLFLAVFACAVSVLFIKESQMDPVLLAAVRLAAAAVVLTPVYLRDLRKHRAAMSWRMALATLLPGAALALHLATWNLGGRLTNAANATLIVNLVPLVMPPLLAWLASERVNRVELLATGVAMLGLATMFTTDYRTDRAAFQGDLICFGSMTLLALYLVLGRRHREQPTIWLYMVPLFYAGAATLFALTPWLVQDTTVDWSREWVWVALLVLMPTMIGHTLFNNAMRYFRGQQVGLASMCQFVLATPLAFLVRSETPSWSFYVAAAMTLTAGAIVLRSNHSHAEPAPTAPDAEPVAN